MRTDSISLDLLHELALLYLGLAHGVDAHLSPAEHGEMVARLRKWQPQHDPALLTHVLRDAALTYFDESTTNRLDEAARILGSSLEVGVKQEIWNDLREVARADGTTLEQEGGFLDVLATQWGVRREG